MKSDDDEKFLEEVKTLTEKYGIPFFFVCFMNKDQSGTSMYASGPQDWIQYYALKIYRSSCEESVAKGFNPVDVFLKGNKTYGHQN